MSIELLLDSSQEVRDLLTIVSNHSNVIDELDFESCTVSSKPC